jgi:hypothetical protein
VRLFKHFGQSQVFVQKGHEQLAEVFVSTGAETLTSTGTETLTSTDAEELVSTGAEELASTDVEELASTDAESTRFLFLHPPQPAQLL